MVSARPADERHHQRKHQVELHGDEQEVEVVAGGARQQVERERVHSPRQRVHRDRVGDEVDDGPDHVGHHHQQVAPAPEPTQRGPAAPRLHEPVGVVVGEDQSHQGEEDGAAGVQHHQRRAGGHVRRGVDERDRVDGDDTGDREDPHHVDRVEVWSADPGDGRGSGHGRGGVVGRGSQLVLLVTRPFLRGATWTWGRGGPSAAPAARDYDSAGPEPGSKLDRTLPKSWALAATLSLPDGGRGGASHGTERSERATAGAGTRRRP